MIVHSELVDVNGVLYCIRSHMINKGLASHSKVAFLGGSYGGVFTTHLIGQIFQGYHKFLEVQKYFTNNSVLDCCGDKGDIYIDSKLEGMELPQNHHHDSFNYKENDDDNVNITMTTKTTM